MLNVRLKAIVYGSDFRRTDAELYATFAKSKGFPGILKGNEVYLFVSGMENQLCWFLNSIETETSTGIPMDFVDSRRWRFTRRTRWNPNLLSHYAKAVGMNLIGVNSFSAAFKKNRENRLEHERELRAVRRAHALASTRSKVRVS